MASSFGVLIREWRSQRRYSQLELSLAAELSSRHLSFLESGRASPSRAMVLKLSEALGMPKGVANQALHAAGFAPAFPKLPREAPDLAPVRAAIAALLANHEPLPAVAIDQHWDVFAANEAAMRLFAALGVPAANMIEALIVLGAGEAVVNWEETAFLALQRLRAEIAHLGGEARLEALAAALAGHRRLAGGRTAHLDADRAVIPTVFRIDGERLSMFSTIAQFGSVQDVAASEFRVEMMFPADEPTRRHFESQARGAKPFRPGQRLGV